MKPGMVTNFDLGDPEPLHLHQGGEKTVHSFKELNIVEALPPKRFQGTTGIGNFLFTQFVPHCIADF